MTRFLLSIKDSITQLLYDKEASIMLYLIGCGAAVNLAALCYGIYLLIKHVRFV